MWKKVAYLIVWVLSLAGTTFAFNVDIATAKVFQGPEGSKFGFAVAQHKEGSNSWLLAGAPEAQTDQLGVIKGGAVYKCNLNLPSSCQQITFDRNGSNFETNGLQKDNKSNQWFGASVQSSGKDGVIVACAPRYVHYSINNQRIEPVGTCWIAKDSFTNFEEYSPCRSNILWGQHTQGYCQAGFSAAITDNGKRLYIGAVGSWYWQGEVFSKDLEQKNEHTMTRESPSEDDGIYLGYSVASGEFTGDSDADVVVGVPRANNLTGKVAIFNSALVNIFNVSGEQMGSYFGYALASADVDGDGLDDIIVGAPFYTDSFKHGSKYEEGRVYIIYQSQDTYYRSKSFVSGEVSKGRFGMAVTSLGDINLDGIQDFAVGAPYAGPDGRGAVYIYLGSKAGVNEKYSQIITPNQIGDPNLKTFGFSLSGRIDLDSNHFPDLLVGAYESNSAVYLRSRPVVNVSASLTLEPDSIVLEERSCNLQDGSQVNCIKLKYCLEYSGLGVDDEMEMTFQIKLDANKPISRAFFQLEPTRREKNFTQRLRKNQRLCSEIYSYVQNNIRDKLVPIAMHATYHLVDPDPYRKILKPILNKKINATTSKLVNIQKNCGPDNLCIPDLQLSIGSSKTEYLIGDKKKLEIDVAIANKGEDAFESMFYLFLPLDVHYINIKDKENSSINCIGANPEKTGVNELICDIGNPLPAGESIKFKVQLAPSKVLSSSVDNLEFIAKVNSTNSEDKRTMEDNKQFVKIPVRVVVDPTTRGISEPPTLTHNVSITSPEDKDNELHIGPEVLHIYEIGNKGPSTIVEADIHIMWPSYDLDENPLLYLIDQPEVRGKASCQNVEHVNLLGLQKVKKPRSADVLSISDLNLKGSFEDLAQRELHKTTRRRKREISFRDKRSLAEELTCDDSAQCIHIKCKVTNLQADDQVVIILRSRLWTDSLNHLEQDEVSISSKMVMKVTQLPYDIDPSRFGHKTMSVYTKVNLEGVVFSGWGIPWWVILLAILVGLLLLALLALLLWKLGFFKRKRPDADTAEKEPLQKNGYNKSKGDEAL